MHAAFGEVVLFYCLMSKVKKKKREREKTFPAVSNMHMVATAPQPMGIYGSARLFLKLRVSMFSLAKSNGQLVVL